MEKQEHQAFQTLRYCMDFFIHPHTVLYSAIRQFRMDKL